MDYKMVVDSDLVNLSMPERYFAYAEAYGNAARALTHQMISDPEQSNWPNAAVVLMLSVHAVELFLKGAIFSKDTESKVNHHDIDELADLYSKEFPDEKCAFSMPFKTEYLGMSEAEIEVIKQQSKLPAPSVLFRYPTASGKEEWKGAYGFEPNSFFSVIEGLLNDFAKLKKCFTQQGFQKGAPR